MAVFEVAKDIGGATIGHFECTGDDALVTFGSVSGDSRISQAYDHLMMTLSVRLGWARMSIISSSFCWTKPKAYAIICLTDRGPCLLPLAFLSS